MRIRIQSMSSANRTLVANGQFMAAFGPAPGQHCPPIRRFHAHTEAMSFGALAVIGLERTFWHSTFLRTFGHTSPLEVIVQTLSIGLPR